MTLTKLTLVSIHLQTPSLILGKLLTESTSILILLIDGVDISVHSIALKTVSDIEEVIA